MQCVPVLSFSVCIVNVMLSLLPVCYPVPLRMGGWSRSGLDMDDIASGSSEVTCLSSHLTSFAILVDASGVTEVRCCRHRWCHTALHSIGLCIQVDRPTSIVTIVTDCCIILCTYLCTINVLTREAKLDYFASWSES